jgi:hypothetical protein
MEKITATYYRRGGFYESWPLSTANPCWKAKFYNRATWFNGKAWPRIHSSTGKNMAISHCGQMGMFSGMPAFQITSVGSNPVSIVYAGNILTFIESSKTCEFLFSCLCLFLFPEPGAESESLCGFVWRAFLCLCNL